MPLHPNKTNAASLCKEGKRVSGQHVKIRREKEGSSKKSPQTNTQTNEDIDLSDATVPGDRVSNTRRIRSKISKEKRLLKGYAIVSAAARLLGVRVYSVQLAVATGRLKTLELAGGTRVVKLEDCEKLWPAGVPRRPGPRPNQ